MNLLLIYYNKNLLNAFGAFFAIVPIRSAAPSASERCSSEKWQIRVRNITGGVRRIGKFRVEVEAILMFSIERFRSQNNLLMRQANINPFKVMEQKIWF
jgi:hypothetical protein